MSVYKQKFCRNCTKNVLAVANNPKHVMHFILTILTIGLWIIVWVLATMLKTFRCPDCGSKV